RRDCRPQGQRADCSEGAERPGRGGTSGPWRRARGRDIPHSRGGLHYNPEGWATYLGRGPPQCSQVGGRPHHQGASAWSNRQPLRRWACLARECPAYAGLT
ncbi:unnamed protein product, partial [Pylaiella littoralis]